MYAGAKFYTNVFSVHFIKGNDNNALPVFGFTVSKKNVSKKAVVRNLVRRRLRESIRQYFNHESFYGYEFVFTALKTTKDSQWHDYVDCVEYSQRRIKKIEAV